MTETDLRNRRGREIGTYDIKQKYSASNGVIMVPALIGNALHLNQHPMRTYLPIYGGNIAETDISTA